MAKRIYTDDDRAAVWMALQVNEGAVAQTSRDTGVPEQTVREWKKKWEKEPPTFDQEVFDKTQDTFLEDAIRVRDKLLKNYESALDAGKVNVDKMPIHIGILVDKVAVIRNVRNPAHDRPELPSPEHMREMFRGAIIGALEAAREREADIIDVEVVEQVDYKALPASDD